MENVTIISNRDIRDECMVYLSQKETVLDLGSPSPYYKKLAKYKDLFQNTHYYCMDINADLGPHFVGDIMALPIKSESADGVICNAVLEHLPEPHRAVCEIHRILKPGGKVWFYVPFLHPYHGSKHSKDYFRFTKDAIQYLFRDFDEVVLQPVDSYVGVTMRFVSGFGRAKKLFKPIEIIVELLIFLIRRRKLSKERNTSGFNIWVKK